MCYYAFLLKEAKDDIYVALSVGLTFCHLAIFSAIISMSLGFAPPESAGFQLKSLFHAVDHRSATIHLKNVKRSSSSSLSAIGLYLATRSSGNQDRIVSTS